VFEEVALHQTKITELFVNINQLLGAFPYKNIVTVPILQEMNQSGIGIDPAVSDAFQRDESRALYLSIIDGKFSLVKAFVEQVIINVPPTDQ